MVPSGREQRTNDYTIHLDSDTIETLQYPWSSTFYRTKERITTPRIVPIIIIQSQPLVALYLHAYYTNTNAHNYLPSYSAIVILIDYHIIIIAD